MRKKIFIITLPSMPESNLYRLKYKSEEGDFVSPSLTFPGLAMFLQNYKQDDIIKIVTVQTETGNDNQTACRKRFDAEFSDACGSIGRNFHIDREILIPFEENHEKQKLLLRGLDDIFEDSCDIYMDITYGSKLTSVAMFSSLVCAEIAYSDKIKSVCYGKYAFDGTDEGVLFDSEPLYDTVRLMEIGKMMSKKQAQNFIRDMLE